MIEMIKEKVEQLLRQNTIKGFVGLLKKTAMWFPICSRIRTTWKDSV